MCRGRKYGKRTGKRFWILISCLFLLTGIIWNLTFLAAEALQKQEAFDNPIDAKYLPLLSNVSEKGKTRLLKEYEKVWEKQLEDYLDDYRARCDYQSDRDMVDEYFDAVYQAVDAQKDLMEYMNVPREEQIWYSARIYYYAYVKDLKGGFEDDCFHVSEMGEGRENFDIEWCNKLAHLTTDFYETLDEQGKELAGIWQSSREKWKEASSNRFWHTPEELNSAGEDASFWENGTSEEIMEVHGWINILYCQQLESIIQNM